MNLNLATSFLIGGLVLISIFGVNANMMQQSAETSLVYQVQSGTRTISEVLSHDLRKVGFRVNDSTKVITAEPTHFAFCSDIDNNGQVDTIQWIFDPSSPDLQTPNPNDYMFYRVLATDSTSFGPGVKSVGFVYMDQDGALTSTLSAIRRIQVKVQCESPEAMENRYLTSAWEETIIPANL